MTKNDKEFLLQIKRICDYWVDQPSLTNVRDKVEGAAFSILVLLDGCSSDSNGYSVRPINDDGTEGKELSSYLHEVMYRVFKDEE